MLMCESDIVCVCFCVVVSFELIASTLERLVVLLKSVFK